MMVVFLEEGGVNIDITARQMWSYFIENIKPFPISIFVLFLVVLIGSIDLSLRPYLLKVILNRLTNGTQTDVFVYLAGPSILIA